MLSKRMRRAALSGRGFAIVELAVVVVVALVAISIAAVGARQSRLGAGLAGSLANLKKYAEATGSYGADFDDQLWAFSWSPGNCPSGYSDLQNAATSAQAIGYQATDIVRRRFDESIRRLDDRLAAPYLTTLVLADYLDEPIPLEWAVSPGDSVRLRWQADPFNPPDLNEQGGDAWDWHFGVFGSSYLLMPAFYAPDEKVGGQTTISQHTYHYLYLVPNTLEIGGRRLSEVLYPSAKVHLAERASYFFGPRAAFFMHRAARVPLLMADGSTAPRTGADANTSFNPNVPDDADRVTVTDYVPNRIYEVDTLSGYGSDARIETHYKWTRRGLRGVDFNGERAE